MSSPLGASYTKAYRKAHAEEIKVSHQTYYQAHKEELKARQKAYDKANSEKINIYKKAYRQRPKTKEMISERRKKQRMTDPKIRLNEIISNAIRDSLNGKKGGQHWEDLVGWVYEDLVKYLTKQFLPGMTFENYGEWQIHHVIPQNKFNIISANDIDFRKCWALKNLKPLWEKDHKEIHREPDKPFQPTFAFGNPHPAAPGLNRGRRKACLP